MRGVFLFVNLPDSRRVCYYVLMAKKRLVVGNWKMYIESPEEAKKFAVTLRRKVRSMPGVDVYVAPPFSLLPTVADALSSSPIKVGAQTISAFADGQHTGDVSGAMLKEYAASFAIVGHSERRAGGESNELIAKQVGAAAEAGLAPILCVGERERDEGGGHFNFISEQLSSALKNISQKGAKKLVVAYEPVWAIGKAAADAMRPQDLEQMVIFIKKVLAETLERTAALKVPILYGGSVDGTNAKDLVGFSGISGFLVGRASTRVESFVEIITAVRHGSR